MTEYTDEELVELVKEKTSRFIVEQLNVEELRNMFTDFIRDTDHVFHFNEDKNANSQLEQELKMTLLKARNEVANNSMFLLAGWTAFENAPKPFFTEASLDLCYENHLLVNQMKKIEAFSESGEIPEEIAHKVNLPVEVVEDYIAKKKL